MPKRSTCRGYTAAEMDSTRPAREIAQCRHRMRKHRRYSESDRVGMLIGSLDWQAELALMDREAGRVSCASHKTNDPDYVSEQEAAC